MKKKIINGILLVAVLVAASSAFVSCKDNDADSQTELLGKIANLENQIKSLQQQAGPQGPQGPQGEVGPQGPQGEAGAPGANGKDGLTPFIGDNGNWWIGTTDTGVKAQGENGLNGENGKDGQNGKDGETPFIGDNGNWWIGTTDTGVKAKGEDGATFDATDILNRLAELEKLVEELKNQSGTAYDDSAIKAQIEAIQKALEEIQKKLDVLTGGEVYSLSAELVSNPLFGFNLPFDVKSNILVALYGEAKKDIYFRNPLTGENEPIAEAGGKITKTVGNAGKVYVTVNPSNVDFTDKVLKLVNTAGQVAPVQLSGLKVSNKVVSFATRAENAFYEAEATIAPEDLDELEFTWNANEAQNLKETVSTTIRERGKEDVLALLQNIINIFQQNQMAAYRLQATWGDNNHTYSAANIAAVSYKPFTFDFALDDVVDFDGDYISALESVEEYIVNTGTRVQGTRNRIWNFLNRFNKEANAYLENINWAVQPTLLIGAGEETIHPTVAENSFGFTRIKEGEITLIPTSWTAELVAPAYKKFVAVVAVDGELVKADDPVNYGYLGQVIDGGITEIPLTIEAGKTYRIQYSAMDYSGKIKNLFYTIRGTK